MPTYPVDLEAWLTPFRAAEQTFDLGEGLTVQNQTAGGEVIRSGGSARLWRGRFVLGRMRNDDAARLEARLHALRGPGAYFTIRDYRRSGTITAVLAHVQANGTINLTGGPASTFIRGGDYISFGYAGRLALHQVVSGVTLTAAGAASGLDVIPPVRSGWVAGTAVTIGTPRCRAVMVPGSLNIGRSQGLWHEGISFDWIQTLRETP